MRPKPLKDTRQEARLFVARALVSFFVMLLMLGILASRFWFLQVAQYDELHGRSDANRILARPLAPARGLIYDRNGVLLAENIAAFRLEVIPEQVKDMPALMEGLRAVVGLSDPPRLLTKK